MSDNPDVSRREYNASRDGCTGELLKMLSEAHPVAREAAIKRWTLTLQQLRATGLDMDVPIGKVLAAIKSYDRITRKLENNRE